MAGYRDAGKTQVVRNAGYRS